MSDEKEKRMAENYKITHGIPIGDKEVVLGVDEKAEMPYLCAFYTSNELFGSYTDCMVGNDYVEIVEMFAERVKAQCVKIREEQAKVTVPREVITADMCLPEWAKERFAEIQKQEAAKAAPNKNQNKDMEVR